MTKTVLLLAVGAIASTLPLAAQSTSALSKPLSEAELLSTIDSLGTGDPAKKAPLSATDAASANKQDKKSDKNAPTGKGPTEITAQEASFDQKTHQAVFAGQVVVKNPEFNITCDKLTAFLRNENAKAGAPAKETPANGSAKPAATPAPAPAAGQKPASKDSSGLEKAIAEGTVVITQEKLDSEGHVSRNVGHARRAVYDSATGDVVLTGRPEVQQGINTCIALDDSTVITLNREGRMKVVGPHKTVIKDAPENPAGPTASNGRR